MSPRPLRVEQALDLLPDLDELLPLRDALIGASRSDEQRAWAAAEAYATVESRLADPDALEAQIPELVGRAARRLESVYRHVAEALRGAKRGDAAAAARELIAAGELEEGAHRLDAAERFYRKALELGRKPRDRRGEGLALLRLARVARARGELDRSRRRYREGFEVLEAQQDREGMVVGCQGLGNVSADLGAWAEAGRWYERGVALLAAGAPTRPLWQLQSNLSVVARRMGRLDESRRWLDEATRTVDELDDAAGRVFVRNAAGLLHVAEGDLEGAESAYRSALIEGISPEARSTVLLNLAECLLLRGRPAESEGIARQVEAIAVTYRLTRLLPHVYRALGAVARVRRDPEGFIFYEEALELHRAAGASPIELAATQHEYGRLEAELGALDSATARLREAEEIVRGLGAAPEAERIREDLSALEARRAGPEEKPDNE